ncbi:MAG TPA: transposase [Bdellovibrionota bacterium]|nr:transposase [Bdellovibrionota bacterium]
MPRKSRNLQIQDGDSFHTMWQCHNKSFLFESEFIKGRYYELLLKYATKFGVKIHAYCFMSSHPHLYGTLSSVPDFIKFQHVVNLGLAKETNKKYDRVGQVVRDRYKVVRIEHSAQEFKTQLYIDLNPVQSGIVSHPKHYPWSSFHYYAYEKDDILITPSQGYLSLGSDDLQRRSRYLELIEIWVERSKILKEINEIPHP